MNQKASREQRCGPTSVIVLRFTSTNFSRERVSFLRARARIMHGKCVINDGIRRVARRVGYMDRSGIKSQKFLEGLLAFCKRIFSYLLIECNLISLLENITGNCCVNLFISIVSSSLLLFNLYYPLRFFPLFVLSLNERCFQE